MDSKKSYEDMSVEDILDYHLKWIFIPRIDCVMRIHSELDAIESSLGNWVQTEDGKRGMEMLDRYEDYLQTYVNHTKTTIAIYAYSDSELEKGVQKPGIRPVPDSWRKTVTLNAIVSDPQFWASFPIRRNKTEDTLWSIANNLGFLYAADFALGRYRDARYLLTWVSEVPLERVFELMESFEFYKTILTTYELDLGKISTCLKYDSSDYYQYAFRAYQGFSKLRRKSEADRMEREVADFLSKNPDAYWALYYYRVKFFETGKNEFLVNMRDAANLVLMKMRYESYVFEKELASAHVLLCDAVLQSDMAKIEDWIRLTQFAIEKARKEGKGVISHDLRGDLSYEGLLSVFRMYGILFRIRQEGTRVDWLSDYIAEILKIQMDWKFRHEFDFHWKSALKYLLFLQLSDLENLSEEQMLVSAKTIDEVMIENLTDRFYDDQEIRYFQIAKSILENATDKRYVPPTDFILEEVVTDGRELALDVKVFWLVLAHARWIRMRKYSDKEKAYRVIYESLVEMWRKKKTYSQFDEEVLRDVLCDKLTSKMPLNVALAEVKTWAWKTDVYVISKEPGKEFFRIILECLIWGGQKHYWEKKSQLSGYLDPTDVDAGLVTFSKNADFESVLKWIESQSESQSDYVPSSFSPIEYIQWIHNYAYGSKHMNRWWKVVDIKHFCLDLST